MMKSNNKIEKTIKEKIVYKGKIVTLYNDSVLANNNIETTREYISHPGGVCVLAVINNKFALIKQYRYAFKDFLYELPAGKLEKNEDPNEAAKRELEEEIGFKADTLIPYGELYPTVGYSNEIIYLFVAENLIKTQTHFDVDENIELVFLDATEVKRMLNENIIKDSKTIVLLMKYLATKGDM